MQEVITFKLGSVVHRIKFSYYFGYVFKNKNWVEILYLHNFSHYLGLEVATYMARKNVASIHVLVRGECPLENVFGKRVGSVFKKVMLLAQCLM